MPFSEQEVMCDLRIAIFELRRCIDRGGSLRPHGGAVECQRLIEAAIVRLERIIDELDRPRWDRRTSSLTELVPPRDELIPPRDA